MLVAIERGEIDRVIVIAPRSEVVNQWAGDFLSGRIAVLYEGNIVGVMERDEADVETIGLMMAGAGASA